MAAEAELTFAQRHHFVIRRLHSLTGIVPVGFFLIFHLIVNGTILAPGNGAEFQRSVNRIHGLGALVLPLEILFIFVPILFHALLGVQIWLTSMPNARQYQFGSNVRYTLQRITGIIAFVFILYHVWHMHWIGKPFGGSFFVADMAPSTAAAAIQQSWWITPWYAIGVLASVYHLANGIWTSLITWGITVQPRQQRGAGYACAAFGIILALIGLGALGGFATFDADAPGQVAPVRHSAEGATPSAEQDVVQTRELVRESDPLP